MGKVLAVNLDAREKGLKAKGERGGREMLKELIAANRSYRRFFEDYPIDLEILKELVDLARLSASGANLQPLKYFLSCDQGQNAKIFTNLAWAGYLRDWPGPEKGERPSAYIIILGDRTISTSFGCDHGIAAQSILLGATEKGLGGCIINSVHRENLKLSLNLPGHCDILLVIALGKPKEKVVIDPLGPDGDIKYWRDRDGVCSCPYFIGH
jgi:nitroreductase